MGEIKVGKGICSCLLLKWWNWLEMYLGLTQNIILEIYFRYFWKSLLIFGKVFGKNHKHLKGEYHMNFDLLC